MTVLGGGELDQLAREPREHESRIADHGQQHLAQRFGLRRFEFARGGRHRREADVAEMPKLAREADDGRAEVLLDLGRFVGSGGERGLREQRGGEQVVFGQRGDDDGGLDRLVERVCAPRPSPPVGQRAHR